MNNFKIISNVNFKIISDFLFQNVTIFVCFVVTGECSENVFCPVRDKYITSVCIA